MLTFFVSKNFFLILSGFSEILVTSFLILETKWKQIDCFCNFLIFKTLANPYLISYLPQQFLYFFPEPHVQAIQVFIVLSVFT